MSDEAEVQFTTVSETRFSDSVLDDLKRHAADLARINERGDPAAHVLIRWLGRTVTTLMESEIQRRQAAIDLLSAQESSHG